MKRATSQAENTSLHEAINWLQWLSWVQDKGGISNPNSKKSKFFIAEVHLALKLVYRNSTLK